MEQELFQDLLWSKPDPSNGLGDEVRDMDCLSPTLLVDQLLILCEPHLPVVFIGVEDCFILHNQYMFLLTRLKYWWNPLEGLVVISRHQTIVLCEQTPRTLNASHLPLIFTDQLNEFLSFLNHIWAFMPINV